MVIGLIIGGIAGAAAYSAATQDEAQNQSSSHGAHSIKANEIYKQITSGPGSGSIVDAQRSSDTVQARFQQRVNTIDELNRTMESAWTGDGGGGARRGAQPLRVWMEDSHTNLGHSSRSLDDQYYDFTAVSSKVQPMPEEPPESGFLNDINPLTTDTDRAIQDYNRKANVNIDAFNEYFGASNTNAGRMPSYSTMTGDYGNVDVETEPNGGGDDPGDAGDGDSGRSWFKGPSAGGHAGDGSYGPGGGSGGGSYGPGSLGGGGSHSRAEVPAANYAGPETGGGGDTPGGDYGSGKYGSGNEGPNQDGFEVPDWTNGSTDTSSSTAPSSTVPNTGYGSTGFGPGSGGYGSAGFGPGSGGYGPGSGGYGSSSGGYGGYGGAGGSPGGADAYGAGGFGPRGSGSLSGGAASGAAAPGSSSGSGGYSGSARAGSGPGSSAGRGMMGPMGAGRGQGGDSEEHDRKYLIEEDANELFGTDQKTPPPVIGE